MKYLRACSQQQTSAKEAGKELWNDWGADLQGSQRGVTCVRSFAEPSQPLEAVLSGREELLEAVEQALAHQKFKIQLQEEIRSVALPGCALLSHMLYFGPLQASASNAAPKNRRREVWGNHLRSCRTVTAAFCYSE